MNILSIYIGHDSNVTLLKDNQIFLYFKEERLSRLKRDCIPMLSIKKIFEVFEGEIDYFIISSLNSRTDNQTIFEYLVKHYNVDVNKIIISRNLHHISHSFLSFVNSGFDECISIVVDGGGSKFFESIAECETVFIHSRVNGFKEIQKNFHREIWTNYLNSHDSSNIKEIEKEIQCECNYSGTVGGIVSLYCTASYLIGQNMLENGKVMGLSSYGEKIENFPKLFRDNSESVEESFFSLDARNKIIFHNEYIGKGTFEVTKENYKTYADYAYEIQKQTQEKVGDLIEKSVQRTGIKNVCISGGYGMNVVANHYYLKRFPNLEFHFEPLSDDGSISIGVSKFLYYSKTEDKQIFPLKTTSFHGVYYDVSPYKGKTAHIKDVAKILHQNKSVAVYTGLAEAGQRALGNRSIFFNALNLNAKDIVNRIKKREWYRPFACVVLEEDASLYFNMSGIKSSPFMTICFPVREEYINIIPGVTHVDNTCRIQTVSKENGYLYELLQEFKKLSNHGILLNTSFNLAGEPLVETPNHAFDTLKNSSLDHLWFEQTNQLFDNPLNIE